MNNDVVVITSPRSRQSGFEGSPFPDARGRSISQEQFRTFLLGSFSAIALVLAAIGIFGVISYAASHRTHEIGIRMALGAQRRDVLHLILGQGAKLALLGVGIGIVLALLLTRLIASLLYSVSATEPLTFASVAIVLLGVAVPVTSPLAVPCSGSDSRSEIPIIRRPAVPAAVFVNASRLRVAPSPARRPSPIHFNPILRRYIANL